MGEKESGGNPYQMIGKAIRDARERRGLSIEHLAALAQLSHQVLAGIEAGRADFSLGALERIAGALDLSVVALIAFAYGAAAPAAD